MKVIRRHARVLATLALVALPLWALAQDIDTDQVRTPESLRRAPDQTYLTYPEWFLVFSPEEYANWVAEQPPTDFPFLQHVVDVWAGYAGVTASIPADQPTNWAYHAMIWVIAGSTTAEYSVNSVYESTMGRLSAATVFSPQDDGQLTSEDRFGAEVSRDYERFLRQAAWYDFDYESALRRLWTEVPFTWSSPVRTLERRYALTSEFVFKLGYAQLLRWASHTTFEEASFEAQTSAVIRGLTPSSAIEGMRVEQVFDDGALLVVLPRYEAFMDAATAIAEAGGDFEEICGNEGAILVTLRAAPGTASPGRALRRETMSDGRERLIFDVPIGQLASVLRSLPAEVELEHIFDF